MVVVDSDSEEEVYNPLDIPLGWDGKPIPYWLYKLHGLNQVCCHWRVFRWGVCSFDSHRCLCLRHAWQQLRAVMQPPKTALTTALTCTGV